MDPPFGKVPSQVKPLRHRAGTSPDHVAWLAEVERPVVLVNLLAGPLKQVLQDAVAEPACTVNPPLTLRIQRGDELAIVAGVIQQARRVVVPPSGQPAQFIVQQMERDILHRPAASLGRHRPLRIAERREQCKKVGPFLGKQRADITNRRVREFHIPILHCPSADDSRALAAMNAAVRPFMTSLEGCDCHLAVQPRRRSERTPMVRD